MSRVIVTGAAGFIGFHVCRQLLHEGRSVLGVDRLTGPPAALRAARVRALEPHPEFELLELDVRDGEALRALFARERPERVVHLAAEVGVRDSLQRPAETVATNVTGFVNVLEAAREAGTAHLVFASSSSVYGLEPGLPWSEDAPAVRPISPYAASKRAAELLAHAHASVHGLSITGLRLFTVYGPWGRPDMAIWRFTEAILAGEPIRIFGEGQARDFTYVEDVAEATRRVLERPPAGGGSEAPLAIFNVGRGVAVDLERLVTILEQALDRPAVRISDPMQAGDVERTAACPNRLATWLGWCPTVPVEQGIPRFVAWYRDFTRR